MPKNVTKDDMREAKAFIRKLPAGLTNKQKRRHLRQYCIGKDFTKPCAICGGPVTPTVDGEQIRWSNWRAARFCGHRCKGRWFSETLSGENSPNWHGRMVDTNCDYCGKPIQKTKGNFKRNANHFCDVTCSSRWKARRQKRSRGKVIHATLDEWKNLSDAALVD